MKCIYCLFNFKSKKRTRQEKYCRVLNLINKSVPVGKFLTSAEIKFFNSGSVREFPNVSRSLNETGNKAVPNAGTKSGPGSRRGCSRMLGTGNFLDFSGKFPVPRKCHSGTQTSNYYYCEVLSFLRKS